MMLGKFQVTALSDGTVALPVDKLLQSPKAGSVESLLAKSYLKAPVETSVNGYLIHTGSKLVLIDNGAASLFGPALGKLVGNLRAAGHTPSHTLYAVESEGNKLVVWGDLMHVAAVQFAMPSVTIAFDTDSRAAAPQRAKQYADAAKKGYFVAMAHVSFPGIGKLRADGKGYDWIPTNDTSAP
jgi:hypothetical protein